MEWSTLMRLLVAATVLTMGVAGVVGPVAADTEAGASFNCDQSGSGGGGDAAVSTGDDTDTNVEAFSIAEGIVHFAIGGPGPADCDQQGEEPQDSWAEGHVDGGPTDAGAQVCQNDQNPAPDADVSVDGTEYNTGYCTDEAAP